LLGQKYSCNEYEKFCVLNEIPTMATGMSFMYIFIVFSLLVELRYTVHIQYVRVIINTVHQKYTPIMFKEKILLHVQRYIVNEKSSSKIALAVSLSVYIAFSPYIFFHTVMVFMLAWFFSLNCMLMLAVTYIINNPLTMVVIYLLDYGVGDCLLRIVVGPGYLLLNPKFMEYINVPLQVHTGIEGISFWSFMVGGNLLGILFGVMIYPITRHLCVRVLGTVRI
jgi:uncharacterized protein (DUF2062 family)